MSIVAQVPIGSPNTNDCGCVFGNNGLDAESVTWSIDPEGHGILVQPSGWDYGQQGAGWAPVYAEVYAVLTTGS